MMRDVSPPHPLIGVVFNESSGYSTQEEAGKTLDKIIRGNEKVARDGKVAVTVAAVGLFEAIPRNELRDYTEIQYRFTIRKIESIELLGNSGK